MKSKSLFNAAPKQSPTCHMVCFPLSKQILFRDVIRILFISSGEISVPLHIGLTAGVTGRRRSHSTMWAWGTQGWHGAVPPPHRPCLELWQC